MKKIIFLIVAILASWLSSNAQTPTATLSREGFVKCFYGKEALVNAVNEANEGDNITLSSGLFTGTTIEKPLSIKGAGMMPDTINNIEPTVITQISIKASNTTLEGVYINNESYIYGGYDNIRIIKSTFNSHLYADYLYPNNGPITHCHLINSKCLKEVNCAGGSSRVMYIENSVIIGNGLFTKTNTNSSSLNYVIANNSIIRIPNANYTSYSAITGSSFTNCIFLGENGSKYQILGAGCYAYHCLGVGNTRFFNNIIGTYGSIVDVTNKTETDYSKIFKTYRSSNYTYTDYETFELTDEAKSLYKGDDGTEMGIYGGSIPFTPYPNNPFISKCTMSDKSTPTGVLSVDIEVTPAK